MAARAIWKGQLKIGAAIVPIKLYAAIQDRNTHFHVLENKTKSRVQQRMVTESRKQVAKEDIQKGYEVDPGTFVILKPEEIDRLKAKESRVIGFTRFVPASQLGDEWYERAYYVGPDNDAAKYFALADALTKLNVLGVAKWSMRGKSYIGALRAEGDYLTLIKVRYAEEILSARDLPAPSGRELDKRELRMAEELVSALEGTFDSTEFHDEYRDRLKKFIAAKAKGRHPRLPAVKERTIAAPLEDQLAKSLAAMKRGKRKQVA